MCILRSMFVISGSSLYPGFIIVRFDCNGQIGSISAIFHTVVQ